MTTDLRFVPLTPELFYWATREERDPLYAERATRAQAWYCVPGLSEAMLGRGRVLAAGGLIPIWSGRAEAWMLTSREATRRELVAACNRVKQAIDDRQRDPAFARIEMHVRADAPWCGSFARHLGFRAEAMMRRFDALGRDHWLFARVVEH